MKSELFNETDTFLDMFSFCVQNYPETIALKFDDRSVTYRELEFLSSNIATNLKKHNVQPGTTIGLFLNRSVEILIAIVGVLKAGCSYLPIDTQYPLKRIEYLLSDSQISVVLTEGSMTEVLQKINFVGSFYLVEDFLQQSMSSSNINTQINPDSRAYVIYTSASTGEPKGVIVSHENLMYFIRGMRNVIPFEHGNVLLMLAPISFDLSISETLLPLASGVTVIIANENQQKNPEAFSQVILANHVTMVHCTPSRLKSFLTTGDKLWLTSIDVLMVGGEEFPEPLFKTLRTFYNKKLFNLYGPTEATVWTTFKDLTHSEAVSLGTALNEYYVYVLNDRWEKCNINEEGEIFIGGKGVAQGYLNNEDLTNEKFVDDPFKTGSRLYRTGDVGKFNPEGDLMFAGRVDNQIKIRGYRIDLSEIQGKLMKSNDLVDAAVTFVTNSLGEKIITAYFLSAGEVSIQKLKDYLRNELPEYMIPVNFIKVDEIPLTFNGKINYEALKTMSDSQAAAIESVVEKDEIKLDILKMWTGILNTERADLNDDFFESGGHSLNAIVLISSINEKFNIEFPLIEFLENPTLGLLIEVVKRSCLADS